MLNVSLNPVKYSLSDFLQPCAVLRANTLERVPNKDRVVFRGNYDNKKLLNEALSLSGEERLLRAFRDDDVLVKRQTDGWFGGDDIYDILNCFTKWSEAERQAVDNYLEPKWGINLRQNPDSDLIKNIDALIDASEPLDKDYMVYRSIKNPDKEPSLSYVSKIEPNATVRDDFYSSTACAPNEYNNLHIGFENSVLMRIKLPKGTKGLYIDGYEEFILPRGNQIKINDIKDGIVNCEYILPDKD